MNPNIFLSFLISNIGFWFFLRRMTHQSAVYTSIRLSRWIFYVGVTIFCLIFHFFCDSPVIILVFIGVSLFFLSYLPVILLYRREKIFLEQVPYALELIILAMKSGHSFKNAIKLMNISAETSSRDIWHRFLTDIEVSPSIKLDAKSPNSYQTKQIDLFLKSLQVIYWQKAKNIESLRALYHHYSTVNYFRHRSRQVSLQGRVQSIIMSLFFIPAVTYQWFFNIKANFKLNLVATVLFILGLVSCQLIGRLKKWKI